MIQKRLIFLAVTITGLTIAITSFALGWARYEAPTNSPANFIDKSIIKTDREPKDIITSIITSNGLTPERGQVEKHNIALDHWKLTLPDDIASEVSPEQLLNGYTSEYFSVTSNGSLTFWCPVTGGRTENSKYPRTELREMINQTNDNINWESTGKHVLTARLAVLQAPSEEKVIVGQIHSFAGRPLVKLQWEKGKVAVLIKRFTHGSNEDIKLWFADQKEVFELGTVFDYSLKVVEGKIAVTVDGETITHDFLAEDQAWADETFYFKAGVYCQDNQGSTEEGAKARFSRIEVNHID